MSRKTPPIRDEERALWMALAMADMAIYSHKGREALLSHLSSNEIRRRLSQEFGLNLDRFQDRAREIFDAIYDECKKKDDEERARMREIEAILDEANGTAPSR
jgi:hypothetical protein